MSFVSPVGKRAAQTRCFRNALSGAELAQRDARGQRMSPPGVEAAEGIRTLDVQLGKQASCAISLCKDKWLRRRTALGDRLGVVNPGIIVRRCPPSTKTVGGWVIDNQTSVLKTEPPKEHVLDWLQPFDRDTRDVTGSSLLRVSVHGKRLRENTNQWSISFSVSLVAP